MSGQRKKKIDADIEARRKNEDEARRYLQNIERLYRKIQNSLEEIAQMREMAVSISSVEMKEKVQTSKTPDKIDNAVIKIMEYENDMFSMVDEYLTKRKIIIEQIEGMEDNNYYHILYSKYVLGKPLESLAGPMSYSWRNIKYLHNKALSRFYDLYLK